MRTSRIARDTAKAAELLRTYDSPFRRQTRSSLSSLVSSRPQNEISSKDDAASELPLPSTPSPLSSTFSSDIEDLPCSVPSTSRKRKRIAACTPTTAVHSDSKTSGHHAPVYKASGDVQSERRGSNSPSPSSAITQTKKVRRPATKTVTEAGKVIIHPPLDWEAVYDAVKETRSRFLAPVDTMGCESLAEVHRSPRDQRFQTLISLMLSSQTKDTTTAIAIHNLQTSLPAHQSTAKAGLTLQNILAAEPATLNQLIHAVGFHNNKTRYIKATAVILHAQYNDDIPSTSTELMTLPGVGPKMAHLCMSAAWGVTEGIGVDVHVHRITNLFGWHQTKTPEETRLALEAWLPRERWHEINGLLVGLGQTVCQPGAPGRRRCGECGVGQKGLCPGRVKAVKTEVRSKRVKAEVKGESGIGTRQIDRTEVMLKEVGECAGGGVEIKKEETVTVKKEIPLEFGV